ncbi:MAG: DUF4058 family protein [Chloroflexi bacterium]|nr:DUF4058 family protein [Chloroflexota bacterium]
MANPFPGMSPWLEHPALWGDVRFRLLSAVARYQSPLLDSYYYISIESFTPDAIEETYLEVREAETGQVVTVIEILSPTNKRPGVGRQKYKRKRLEILSTHTNLVEIDLLRAWEPMPFEGDAPASHYRILVRRGEQGSQADLYPFTVYDPIPGFPLPLQAGEAEPPIDLNTLLDDVYAEGSYGIRIDYRQPPRPPLSEDEARWAKRVIVENVDFTRSQHTE